MRRPFVAGNWKMNKGPKDAAALAGEIVAAIAGVNNVDVAVAPVAISLASVHAVVANTNLKMSAQNMFYEENGAYTGELSPLMLEEVGCTYAILGHSERRQIFGEDDELINRKTRAAISHGILPIVCCGETLEERESGSTNDKVAFQVKAALSGIRLDDAAKITVAYEPIWAIGTGRTASPEQAQEVHAMIRNLLAEIFDANAADKIRIQYGGSVKPANINDLIAKTDIDGALVGGASLKADSFAAIVNACS